MTFLPGPVWLFLSETGPPLVHLFIVYGIYTRSKIMLNFIKPTICFCKDVCVREHMKSAVRVEGVPRKQTKFQM